jgi:signal transduction histidine kinase
MPLYAILPFICFLVFAGLGFFVLFQKPKTSERTLFSLLCFEAFYWQLVWFVSFFTSDSGYLDYLATIAYLTITFLPFTFYHFIVSYLRLKRERPFVLLFYGLGLILTLLLPTGLFVAGHQKYSWGNFAAPGPFYPVYMVSALLTMTRGITLLLKALKNPQFYGVSKNQLHYIFLGLVLYYLCAVDFAQIYGASWYPVGVFFFLGSFSVISYAIVRHRLMDIEVVVRRTLVFAGLFSFIFGIFAFMSFLITDVLQQRLEGGMRWWLLMSAAVLVAFTSRRLESWLVNLTDRYLFQRKYNYHKLLKENSRQIAFIHSLDELAKQIVVFLIKQGRIKNAAILTRSDDDKGFDLKCPLGYGGRARRPVLSLDDDHPLIQLLIERETPIVLETIEKEFRHTKNADSRASGRLEKVLELMRVLKAEVVIPSFLGEASNNGTTGGANYRLRNVLILGQKKSDDAYTDEDLDVFFTIAQDSAIAAENARLFGAVLREKESKLKAEKQAEMVRYAKTIAHEIKNALTGVYDPAYFVMRYRVEDLKNFYRRFLGEQKAAGAERQLEEICKQLEHHGETIRTNADKIFVIAKTTEGTLISDESLHEEIYFRILWNNSKDEAPLQGCRITSNIPENFVIHGNVVQLQRVFVNLLANAAEAMGAQEEKKIHLEACYREIEGNKVSWFELRDNGPGIPNDIQSRIFEQGFSTKPRPARGDIHASGYGHGLYVCKKIIEEMYQGKIWAECEHGRGTAFVFWIPVLQMAE